MTNENIYQLRVLYADDSEIYRVMKICGKNTLDDLSDAILDSFEFDKDHMYLFNMDMELYGDNSYELDPQDEEKSTKTSLNKIIKEEDQTFIYLFDFGDEWVFIIVVEKIEKSKCVKPELIESEGKLEQYEDFDEDF